MNKFKPGDKVTWRTTHSTQKGIVKEAAAEYRGYFVVYKCRDDWKNYQQYTAQLSDARYLFPGWPDE